MCVCLLSSGFYASWNCYFQLHDYNIHFQIYDIIQFSIHMAVSYCNKLKWCLLIQCDILFHLQKSCDPSQLQHPLPVCLGLWRHTIETWEYSLQPPTWRPIRYVELLGISCGVCLKSDQESRPLLCFCPSMATVSTLFSDRWFIGSSC